MPARFVDGVYSARNLEVEFGEFVFVGFEIDMLGVGVVRVDLYQPVSDCLRILYRENRVLPEMGIAFVRPVFVSFVFVSFVFVSFVFAEVRVHQRFSGENVNGVVCR